MNRIEMKIVLLVADRLSAAEDSEEKTEMIEELSENLYQHYLDLTAAGVPEQEALGQAMDGLGDVEELLEYLKETQDAGPDSGSFQEQKDRQNGNFSNAAGEKIEDIVKRANSVARTAVENALDMARDVTVQIKERCPNDLGMFLSFPEGKGQRAEGPMVWRGEIRSLECRLTNGNIRVCMVPDGEAPVEIDGEADEIESVLKEDGTLVIRQGKTASSSFLFHRGMRRSDIELRLPARMWEKIGIVTTNGDISVEEGISCRTMTLQSMNGDCELQAPVCEHMKVQLSNGDLGIHGMKGDLTASDTNGDIRVSGNFGVCTLTSASGDVKLDGTGREIECSSNSGDIRIRIEELPAKLKAVSRAGDCDVRVPREKGFFLTYRVGCGDFHTDFPLHYKESKDKTREAVYQDGGECQIVLSAVSGDLHLHT